MSTSTALKAQQTDLQLVETTLNYYIDGLVENDAEELRRAFQPTATMKWVDQEYKEVNAVEALVKGLESFPREQVKTRIVSINIAGNAASGQLELELPDFIFIDLMHLLKIDGEWKIVSKTYYKKG